MLHALTGLREGAGIAKALQDGADSMEAVLRERVRRRPALPSAAFGLRRPQETAKPCRLFVIPCLLQQGAVRRACGGEFRRASRGLEQAKGRVVGFQGLRQSAGPHQTPGPAALRHAVQEAVALTPQAFLLHGKRDGRQLRVGAVQLIEHLHDGGRGVAVQESVHPVAEDMGADDEGGVPGMSVPEVVQGKGAAHDVREEGIFFDEGKADQGFDVDEGLLPPADVKEQEGKMRLPAYGKERAAAELIGRLE